MAAEEPWWRALTAMGQEMSMRLNVTPIVRILQSKGRLTEEEKQQIGAESTDMAKNDKLVDTLKKKSRKHFDAFLETLRNRDVDLADLADKLEQLSLPAIQARPSHPRSISGKPHTFREPSFVQGASLAQPTKQQQHILISYQHRSQSIVRKLVDRLQKENFKVWVDFNDICNYANITRAMADALENAWVVFVCMSLRYKDSEFSRIELEYAHDVKKRIILLKMDDWTPDGWISLLAGHDKYYDFSNSSDFETNIRELLRALCGGGDRPVNFSKWGKSQVQDWCHENDIPGGKCKDLDGKQLKMLKNRKDHTPDVYQRTLDKEFQFSLAEATNFDTALDALELP